MSLLSYHFAKQEGRLWQMQCLLCRVLGIQGDGSQLDDSFMRLSDSQAAEVWHVSVRNSHIAQPDAEDRVWQQLRLLKAVHLLSCQLDSLPNPRQWRHVVSLDLSHSKGLTELPSLEPMRRLQYLSLRHCFDLELRAGLQLPEAVRVVDLSGCARAQSCPTGSKLPELRVLNLNYCIGESLPALPQPAAVFMLLSDLLRRLH